MVDVTGIRPTGFYEGARLLGFMSAVITYFFGYAFFYSWYRFVSVVGFLVATGLILMEAVNDGDGARSGISPNSKAVIYLVAALLTISLIVPPIFFLLVSMLYLIDYRKRASAFALT